MKIRKDTVFLLVVILVTHLVQNGFGEPFSHTFNPNPLVDRYGELFPQTRHYYDSDCSRETRFSLVGKSLSLLQRNDPGAMIPNPITIIPGVFPLGIIENYLFCPVLDTVFLPYDLCLWIRNEWACSHDGILFKIMEDQCHPASNETFVVSIECDFRRERRRVIYNGDILTGSERFVLRTNSDGEFYVPTPVNGYSSLRVTSTNRLYRGTPFVITCLDDGRWETVRQRRFPRCDFSGGLGFFRSVNTNSADIFRCVSMPHFGFCPYCRFGENAERRKQIAFQRSVSMKPVWNTRGECLVCRGRLSAHKEAVRIGELLARKREIPVKSEADVDLVVAYTGISRRRVKEMFDYIPDPVMKYRNVVKINLQEELSDEMKVQGVPRTVYVKQVMADAQARCRELRNDFDCLSHETFVSEKKLEFKSKAERKGQPINKEVEEIPATRLQSGWTDEQKRFSKEWLEANLKPVVWRRTKKRPEIQPFKCMFSCRKCKFWQDRDLLHKDRCVGCSDCIEATCRLLFGDRSWECPYKCATCKAIHAAAEISSAFTNASWACEGNNCGICFTKRECLKQTEMDCAKKWIAGHQMFDGPERVITNDYGKIWKTQPVKCPFDCQLCRWRHVNGVLPKELCLDCAPCQKKATAEINRCKRECP